MQVSGRTERPLVVIFVLKQESNRPPSFGGHLRKMMQDNKIEARAFWIYYASLQGEAVKICEERTLKNRLLVSLSTLLCEPILFHTNKLHMLHPGRMRMEL